MKKITEVKSDLNKATILLNEVVNWWENWISAVNPTEIPDPPIEEIKKFCKSIPPSAGTKSL
jgi:hypothetical protein